jgi:hypothetical protein
MPKIIMWVDLKDLHGHFIPDLLMMFKINQSASFNLGSVSIILIKF